jgi:hypothetical protein
MGFLTDDYLGTPAIKTNVVVTAARGPTVKTFVQRYSIALRDRG